jgi:hypothetical protein
VSGADRDGNGTPVDTEESFLQRFHRRKLAARRGEVLPDAPEAPVTEPAGGNETGPPEPVLTDDDMPPLDSLSGDSDFSGFLSPGVSEDLRRAALRRLWRVADTPFTDDLDIYAGDYTQFESLGGLVTREMRRRLDLEMRRQGESLVAAEAKPSAAGNAQPASAAAEPSMQSSGAEERDDIEDGRTAAAEPPNQESSG